MQNLDPLACVTHSLVDYVIIWTHRNSISAIYIAES
jgi:hypothetical protein